MSFSFVSGLRNRNFLWLQSYFAEILSFLPLFKSLAIRRPQRIFIKEGKGERERERETEKLPAYGLQEHSLSNNPIKKAGKGKRFKITTK